MRKLTERQKGNILKELKNGRSQRSLAKQYGVANSTVALISRNRLNVQIRDTSAYIERKWTRATIDKFLSDNDSTVRRVSLDVKHCKADIEWGCTLCGNRWSQDFDSLKRRNPKGCKACGYDEYTLYHDLLDGELDSRAAYFIGAFFASGKLYGNRVSISNRRKDILECVRELICSSHPISKRQANGYTVYSLSFLSPKMVNRIKEIHADDKTIMPKGITSDLAPHFTRGLMDFRGYMELSPSTDSLSVRVNISGHKAFLQELQKLYAKSIVDKTVKKGYITDYREPCELHFNGKKSPYNFLKWTYNSYVAPIKYIDTKKYSKFLYLRAWFARQDETNEIVKEYIQEYKDAREDFAGNTHVKIAKTCRISVYDVHSISRGHIPSKISDKVLKTVKRRLELNKEGRLKMKEIRSAAVAHADIPDGRFNALVEDF